MNGSLHLLSRSWHSLVETGYPTDRLFPVFAARLDQSVVKALRALFQEDLLARKTICLPWRHVRPDGKALARR